MNDYEYNESADVADVIDVNRFLEDFDDSAYGADEWAAQ
jgi:hypothetical protein